MPQNDIFSSENKGRCSASLFNRLACFGKKHSSDDQLAPMMSLSSEAQIYEIFALHDMNLEQLIKLFIESALLDAYHSQHFPEIFLEDPMPSLLHNLIAFIKESSNIQPSTTVQTVTNLLLKVKDALQDILSDAEQSRNLFRNESGFTELEDFVHACNGFLEEARKRFQATQDMFSSLRDDTSLTNVFIDTCLQYLYIGYKYGRQWAMEFFEYGFLNYAQVNIEHDASENTYSIKMQTASDTRSRYITLTMSSHLCIDDFFKLPLYTFHEYISHLCASTCNRLGEVGRSLNEVVVSFEQVPTELDEGWMVHAAREFLRSKMSTLLEDKHRHLAFLLKGTIDYWIINMHYPFGGINNTEQGRSGSYIADKFLDFLKQDVCKEDERKAYELYYRLSTDLITRYPYADFKHLDFIFAIKKLCKIDKNRAIEIIQSSLDGEGTYINIERLWELLKELPKSSLTLSFRL